MSAQEENDMSDPIQVHLQVVEDLAHETISLMGIVQLFEGQGAANLGHIDRDSAARLLRTVSEKILALSRSAQSTSGALRSLVADPGQ